MLKHLDYDIFSLPTKNKLGLGLFANEKEYFFRRVKEKLLREIGITKLGLGINYQDFNIKYLTQKLIDEQLYDLEKRSIIESVDIGNMLKKYKNSQENSELIKTLVSLEIHLKNGKKLPNSMDEIC